MRHSRFSPDFLARLFFQLALICTLAGMGPAVAADGPEKIATTQSEAIDDGAPVPMGASFDTDSASRAGGAGRIAPVSAAPPRSTAVVSASADGASVSAGATEPTAPPRSAGAVSPQTGASSGVRPGGCADTNNGSGGGAW